MSAEKIVLDYAQEAGFSSVLRLSDPLYEESVVLGIGPVLLVDSDNMPLAYLVCPSKCRLYGKEFDHYAIVIPYEVNFGDDVGADTFYLHIRLSEDEAEELVIVPKWELNLSNQVWPEDKAVLNRLHSQVQTFLHLLRKLLKVLDWLSKAA